MSRLEVCPGCKRHVRVEEESCPFCAVRLGSSLASLPARVMPKSRLGRAALFTFGVSAAAVVSAGCSDEPDADDEGGADAGRGDGGAQNDAGQGQDSAVYGGPPTDAGFPTDGSASFDGNIAPVYGLPSWDSAVPDAGKDAGANDAGRVRDSGGIGPVYGLSPAYDTDDE